MTDKMYFPVLDDSLYFFYFDVLLEAWLNILIRVMLLNIRKLMFVKFCREEGDSLFSQSQ